MAAYCRYPICNAKSNKIKDAWKMGAKGAGYRVLKQSVITARFQEPSKPWVISMLEYLCNTADIVFPLKSALGAFQIFDGHMKALFEGGSVLKSSSFHSVSLSSKDSLQISIHYHCHSRPLHHHCWKKWTDVWFKQHVLS